MDLSGEHGLCSAQINTKLPPGPHREFTELLSFCVERRKNNEDCFIRSPTIGCCFHGFRRFRCCPWRWRYFLIRVCFTYGCGKRSISGPEVEVGLPCKFAEYDTNKDGLISKKEFYATVKMGASEPGLAKDFARTDTNNNGGLDCNEFRESGFEFECKPQACEKSRVNDEVEDDHWNQE